jgi:hypothetical protein
MFRVTGMQPALLHLARLGLRAARRVVITARGGATGFPAVRFGRDRPLYGTLRESTVWMVGPPDVFIRRTGVQALLWLTGPEPIVGTQQWQRRRAAVGDHTTVIDVPVTGEEEIVDRLLMAAAWHRLHATSGQQ